MKRRVLFAFVVLNIIISIVVTVTVATLISQSRPKPTPIALSPVVIVATPTGPTQTPIVVTVIATRDPNAVPYVPELDATDIANTAAAVYSEGSEPDGADTQSSPDEPTERATLSSTDRTVTAAAADELTTHIVQSGEYFGVIAERYEVSVDDLLCQNNLTQNDYIYPGDVLIIPGPEGCDFEPPTETPIITDTPTLTATPEDTPTATLIPTVTLRPTAESAQVKISNVLSPGDVTDEEVILTNEGGLVDLQGWTLSDREGDNIFTFSDYRLFPGGSVSVRTRKGDNTPIVRYWNQDTAMWGDEDATVVLTDDEGNVQSIYVVGEPGGAPPTSPPEDTQESIESGEEPEATEEAVTTPLG